MWQIQEAKARVVRVPNALLEGVCPEGLDPSDSGTYPRATTMLFLMGTRESVVSRPRLLRALFALSLAMGSTSCMWLDDFDKFKIGDAGALPDAQTSQGKADAGPGDRCRDVNCGKMDAECMRGMCDPATGECKAVAVEDGQTCFDGNPCSSGDVCRAGECAGEPIDCSSWDLACSQGMCDPATGACVFGPTMSKSCDDANPCTLDDRCSDQGVCDGTAAAAGAKCDDFNDCTGTADKADACDGSKGCQPGGPVAQGTSCNDDNECTNNERCNSTGSCVGAPTREGQPCERDCTSNTTCQKGECAPPSGDALGYAPKCLQNYCHGLTSLCRDEWKHDRVCQCGCGDDSDCNDACSPHMCVSQSDHKAARWCDKDGKAIDNCPDSLKGDGKCDCGCQFVDPDCSGGACCSDAGKDGCTNAFVRSCVCDAPTTKDDSCCTGDWTQRCADLAVNLGCMVCP